MCYSFGPAFKRCTEEYFQAVCGISKNIICTAAYDDAVAFFRKITYDLTFCFEDLILRCFILHICIQVHLIDQIIEKTVCHDLFVFLNEFRCVACGSCCHLDDLCIIEIVTQLFCKCLTHIVAATSKLSPNGDDIFSISSCCLPVCFAPVFRRCCFREDHGFQECKFLSDESGNKAYQKGCNNSTFSYTIQSSRKYEGKYCSDHCHGYVKTDLGCSKICFPGKNNSTDKGLSRKHDNVCQDFHINAYAQDQTADEQVYDLHDVRFRIDPGKKYHGKIDKISEYNGYRNLKDVLRFKVLSQDNQL